MDPVWQWEWEEGAAETLSTFHIAAQFCEEYEQLIFCHNEALLYQWVEEYDPALFAHIQSLVKRGKWHIMGGWHLQPDCTMPSGEGFVRQIQSGRRYFREKFGVEPTVAVNVDPFGHTRGLVQLLAKSGYTGYLFMRPWSASLELPAEEFRWVGYDGSEVTAIRVQGSYNSAKGHAADKAREYAVKCPEEDVFLCLWGVGNHGGGPSKKDLEDLTALAEEQRAAGVEYIHSTPEAYFSEIERRRILPKVVENLTPWAPGCYTSQIRVKQRYRQAENLYFLTEIMCRHASLEGKLDYPGEELAAALYDLLTVQFHDMLPGSSIEAAEEMALRMLDHALEIVSRVKARGFFALTAGQPQAERDRIPLFAYNPYPYPVQGDFVCEFMLWDQNPKEEFLMPAVYDAQGRSCPAQCEEEASTIPLEWRKRVVFHAELAPMSMNRFACGFITLPQKPVPDLAHTDTQYVFERAGFGVIINRRTGLIDSWHDAEREFVQPGAFALGIYTDDFDPWMMNATVRKEKIGEFCLLSPEETAAFCCVDSPLEPVHVIESGEVRTVVEAVFGYHSARAVMKYILSEEGSLQLDIRLVWNEKPKMVKLHVPAAFEATECLGEQAYGRETLPGGERENVAQKYVALCSNTLAVAAMNDGIYGSSFDDKGHTLKLTLLRSPSYCAHPVDGRKTMPQDRYMPYIEQGERDFHFRFMAGKRQEVLDRVPRMAQQFNMQPMLLSFYPIGTGELARTPLRLEKTDVIQLTALKRAEEGDDTIVRLFNPTEESQTAHLQGETSEKTVAFGPFEVKTLRLTSDGITEASLMD